MKSLLTVLLALLLPVLCMAGDVKLIDGWVVQTLDTYIMLRVSASLNTQQGGKIKAGDVIALDFPSGSPAFADNTRIRVNVDRAGELMKFRGVNGASSTYYTFQVTDPNPPRVLK